jgi:Ca2+-binding RTX toxin-like protein
MADIALAKGKPNSNCRDADIVLSKKYPNFDLNSDCKGAYSKSGECDPDNFNLDDPALSQDPTDTTGWVIAGTNGKNIIHGTSLDDTICGGNGTDEIYGEDGDDVIYGDNGKDSLYGGLGDDDIHGGNGKDSMDGGEGGDTISGDRGKDSCTDPDDPTTCDDSNAEDGPKHH